MGNEVTYAGSARSGHASRNRLGGVGLNESGAKQRRFGRSEPTADTVSSLACRPTQRRCAHERALPERRFSG